MIRNLLDEVLEAAEELGIPVHCIQKVAEGENDLPRLQFTTDNAGLFTAIETSCQVAGGTAWLWARPEAFQSVDVLFIDEAAQMSLATRGQRLRAGTVIATSSGHDFTRYSMTDFTNLTTGRVRHVGLKRQIISSWVRQALEQPLEGSSAAPWKI